MHSAWFFFVDKRFVSEESQLKMIRRFPFTLLILNLVSSSLVKGDEENGLAEELEAWGPVETFESLDIDNDKRISLSEFVNARLKRFIDFDWFSKFDPNGDGHLDSEEIRIIAGPGEAAQIFATADANSDGKVTREENIQYVQDESRRIFQEIDENSDQYLNKTEFLKL